MQNVLVIDAAKCTGCRLCEQVCSVKHEGTVNPYRSRVRVLKWEIDGQVLPMVCRQCDDPPCQNICPMGAIAKDELTGLVSVDYDKCIGCRMCISACPFGAMDYDLVGKKVMKCDLCGGDPQCVRFCDAQAIRFENKSKTSTEYRKLAGTLTKNLTSGIAT
jgi:carbon-monoxide dehydrogenase iron sulfur subunit